MGSKKTWTSLDYVKLSRIEPNPNNPREPIGKSDVRDLKKSIRSVGVLVPLVVFRKKGTKNRFILLEGERRYKACQELYDETKNERFSEVPVNILRTHPGKFVTLKTMFNVHTKRKKWSRAAEAEALGRIIEIGKEKASNTRKLADLTGLDEIGVDEDRTFLRFPEDLRKLAFDGKLREYYLILLGRNLRVLEDTLPELFKQYEWETIVRLLISKVRDQTITRSRDFNYLSSLARTCIEYKSKPLYLEAFRKLMEEPDFDLEDMVAYVDRELGYRGDEAFKQHCKVFEESLSAHIRNRDYRVSATVFEVLSKIADEIGKIHRT